MVNQIAVADLMGNRFPEAIRLFEMVRDEQATEFIVRTTRRP